jgi:hypothetical protein
MNWTSVSERIGLIAVVVSLLYVGYELKRNNDLAVVASQKDLLSLQVEMRGWLVEKEIRQILFSDDISQLSKEDLQTFLSMAMGWFDLFEHAFLSYERGVLSDEQLVVWKNGLCTLPPTFFEVFDQHLYQGNYLDSLVSAVKECNSARQSK